MQLIPLPKLLKESKNDINLQLLFLIQFVK